MRWIGYLVLLVTELAVYNQLSDLGGPSLAFYGYFVVMAVMTFIAIFFHEMGHALAIWKSGGTVHSINVSFLSYNVTKRRLEAAPRSKSREVGGYVAYAFEKRLGTPRKEIMIAAAGPAANLFTGFAAVLLALYLVPSEHSQRPEIVASLSDSNQIMESHAAMLPTQDKIDQALNQFKHRSAAQLYQVVLMAFAVLSLGLALANLVPFQGSDGAAILRNWRKPKQHFGRR